MLHHYTEYCDFGEIAEADVNVQNAIRDYHDIERGVGNSNSNDQMYKERIFPSFWNYFLIVASSKEQFWMHTVFECNINEAFYLSPTVVKGHFAGSKTATKFSMYS